MDDGRPRPVHVGGGRERGHLGVRPGPGHATAADHAPTGRFQSGQLTRWADDRLRQRSVRGDRPLGHVRRGRDLGASAHERRRLAAQRLVGWLGGVPARRDSVVSDRALARSTGRRCPRSTRRRYEHQARRLARWAFGRLLLADARAMGSRGRAQGRRPAVTGVPAVFNALWTHRAVVAGWPGARVHRLRGERRQHLAAAAGRQPATQAHRFRIGPHRDLRLVARWFAARVDHADPR